MSINLANFGKIGIILFVIIAFVFECLFGIIGYYLANFLNLNGFVWWIVVISVVLILNMIFVNNE